MATADVREQILDAVQSVIVRDGVRGTSMRQVATAADVSLGLISYHFDDKDSLLLAAFDRATTRLFDASVEAAAATDEADEKVKAFLRGAFTDEFLDGDYLRVRISLWAVALTDPQIAELDARFFDEYAAAFRSLLRAARPALSTSEISGRVVDAIAITNGVWLNWARYQNAEHLERGLVRSEAIALG